MQTITKQWIDQLNQCDWFGSVGQPISEGVLQVNSWSKATKCCFQIDMVNAGTEAINRICEKTFFTHPHTELRRTWNQFVQGLNPIVDEMADRLIRPIADRQKLPPEVVRVVRSDIQGLLIESELHDLQATTFFTDIARWYLAGHFPCGWKGDYPEGQLIVF